MKRSSSLGQVTAAAGVYALILNLEKPKSITFNRGRSLQRQVVVAPHRFESGWYVYLGSARGAGGLGRRLARHHRIKADTKRMRWNVDFFREHADLTEVWFTETVDKEHEHNWAKAVAGLPGASVPVEGFRTSDCDSGCLSHFFHLPDRPTAGLFRSALLQGKVKTPVSAVLMDDVNHPLDLREFRGQYLAGSRFTEAYRLADITYTDGQKCPSLAIKTPGRALAEEISRSLGINFVRLKPMIEFAFAVDTLLHNFGPRALGVIFDPANPQKRESVNQLSNTSDTRQQYRINKVLNKESQTICPQGSDTVFDTVGFLEVPDRLARARGVLLKLADRVGGIRDLGVKKELTRLLQITHSSAVQLDKLVNNKPPTASALKRLAKDRVMPIVAARTVTGYDVGDARQALRLTIKNVWDYPEMLRRKLTPTKDEKAKVKQELVVIRRTAKKISRAL